MNEEIENINEKIPVEYTLYSRATNMFYIHHLLYSPRKLTWVKGNVSESNHVIYYNILTGNYFTFSSAGDDNVTSFHIDEIEITGNNESKTIRVLYQKDVVETYIFLSLLNYPEIPKLLKDYMTSIPGQVSAGNIGTYTLNSMSKKTYSQDAVEETVSFLEKTL